MIKKQLSSFLVRWIISSLAMYLCLNLFATFTTDSHGMWFYLLAGLVFSLVNTIVRPIVTIFSLPFIFITFGLFTFIINAVMVGITVWIMPGVTINFWGALLSCIVISLINYLVNLAQSNVK